MKNYTKLLMFVALIFTIIMSSQQATAINTCFNTSTNTTVCYQSDSGIYPQNIDLWEGSNEKYGLYVTNPDDDMNYNIFVRAISNAFDSGKIDVTKLGDDTTFEFQSINDFYNLIQQNNAVGNVTLFTTAELNQEMREQNIFLTTEVLQWTITMFIIIMELFKILISIIMIISAIYIFFRLIPFALKQVNILILKVAIGKQK